MEARRPTWHRYAALGWIWGRYLLVAIGAIAIVAPFAYTVSTVLKAPDEVLSIPMQWIPSHLIWSNLLLPFTHGGAFAQYYVNSLIVGIAVTALNLFTCPLAGYSFCKLRYPGRDFLFLIVLATLMIPLEIIYVPLFDLVFKLGWNNSYLGLIIPAGTSAFGIFLMRQTLQAIPDELLDAARMDGASEWAVFWRVVLPLLRPPLAVLAIFIFMTNWDSLLWPLLVAGSDNLWTLPVGLSAMQDAYSGSFSMLMAAALEASAPTLLVYFLLQRYVVAGISLASGVRG